MRILQALEKLLFTRGQEVPRPVAAPKPVVIKKAPPEPFLEPGTPRYPPVDEGIQVATPESIIATQDELIRQLRRNLGLVDADFQRRYMGPIYRAAALVNLLPASRDKHHTGAGGLFRFALTLAVRTAQASEAKIFTANEAIERRRRTEDAWRHAAFLTGLTVELFRPLTDMLVVDDCGNEWSPFVGGLTAWAKENSADRFFVRWHTRDDARSAGNSLSSWAVNAVIGNDLLGDLHAVKPLIVQTIFGVASGAITTADNNTMAALVNEVRRRTIEKDHDVQPLNYGRLTSGSHLEPYFLDCMRALLRNGVWQVNTKGGRCHYGADGFFVAWKSGATEMLNHLANSGIEGVPSSRDTLAEMMGKAGIIKVASDGTWIHVVRAAVGNAVFPAIQVLSPNAIIGNLEIKPVSNNLRSVTVQSKMVAPQPSEVAPRTAAAVPAFELPEVKPPMPVVKEAPAGTIENANEAPAAASTVRESAAEPKSSDGERNKAKKAAKAQDVAQETQGLEAPEKLATISESAPKDIAVPAAPAPRTKQSPTKGAIAAAEEGDSDEDEESLVMPKELLLELGAGNCRELAVLRDKWNRGIDKQHFIRTSDGIGIAYTLLRGLAVQMANFIEALEKAGYLHEFTVAGKKRRLAPLPFGPNKEELAIVLLTAVARKAQFTLD